MRDTASATHPSAFAVSTKAESTSPSMGCAPERRRIARRVLGGSSRPGKQHDGHADSAWGGHEHQRSCGLWSHRVGQHLGTLGPARHSCGARRWIFWNPTSHLGVEHRDAGRRVVVRRAGLAHHLGWMGGSSHQRSELVVRTCGQTLGQRSFVLDVNVGSRAHLPSMVRRSSNCSRS